MTRSSKISLAGVGAFAILAIVSVYGLFRGYFDPGHFEIKRFLWSPTKQVAMVAERSDNDALGGLEYYVLIGNHLFTPAELRLANHSDAPVFSAGSSDCLRLHWDGPNRLIISCNGSAIDPDQINAQKQQIGNIAISYENIAIKE